MLLQAKASRSTMAAQRRGGQARLHHRVMLADRWAAQLGLGGGGDKPQPEDPPGCAHQRRLVGRPILAAQILVERPEDRIYDDIAAAGNALRDELEVDGAQFIEAACNGSVGQTADCAALS
jgi:hypothetical protein